MMSDDPDAARHAGHAGHRHLVLGGARSGKSSFGEQTALEYGSGTATYIATGGAIDDEMAARIEHHQAERDCDKWTVIEEEVDVAGALAQIPARSTVLIDCLTLWLNNCLHHQVWSEHRDRFLDSVAHSELNLVLVSNEVGMGVVPVGKLSRDFVDESGRLHQDLAELCDEVTLIVAGLAHRLKPQP